MCGSIGITSFVQGGGEEVHEKWDAGLVESLRRELGPRYEIRCALMPNEADPKFATWQMALEEQLATLQDGAVVVGHSVGGTILIHTLDNDDIAPIAHVELYAAAIPRARVRRLAGRDQELNNNLSEVASDIRELRSRSHP